MQMASILEQNPDAKVMAISSSAHQGLTEVLRELREMMKNIEPEAEETEEETEPEIPVITLEVKEQKRRAHHQKYQLGERNAILELGQDDAEDDLEDAENI
jgi:hypothetical protein